MGGGPKNMTTTNTPQIPGWLTAPAQNYLGQMGTMSNTPYNPLMNPSVAPFSPMQQAGMNDIVGANPAYVDYAGTGLDTMKQLAQTGGGVNPFLDQYMDVANQNLTKNYTQSVAPSAMSQAMLSGAFGGSGDAESRALNQFSLGQNIGNMDTSIAYPAWQHQLDTQASAASQLPGMAQAVYTPGQMELQTGNQQQSQAQNYLNAIKEGATQTTEWPFKMAQQYGGALSSLLGPYSGSTTISPNTASMSSKLS